MLKGDIIEQICADMGTLMKKEVSQSVDIILETMTKALSNGQRIEINVPRGPLGVRIAASRGTPAGG